MTSGKKKLIDNVAILGSTICLGLCLIHYINISSNTMFSSTVFLILFLFLLPSINALLVVFFRNFEMFQLLVYMHIALFVLNVIQFIFQLLDALRFGYHRLDSFFVVQPTLLFLLILNFSLAITCFVYFACIAFTNRRPHPSCAKSLTTTLHRKS
jgi:hypothetical protein